MDDSIGTGLIVMGIVAGVVLAFTLWTPLLLLVIAGFVLGPWLTGDW